MNNGAVVITYPSTSSSVDDVIFTTVHEGQHGIDRTNNPDISMRDTEINAYAAETQYALDHGMTPAPWNDNEGNPVSFTTTDAGGNTVVDRDAIGNWLDQNPLLWQLGGKQCERPGKANP